MILLSCKLRFLTSFIGAVFLLFFVLFASLILNSCRYLFRVSYLLCILHSFCLPFVISLCCVFVMDFPSCRLFFRYFVIFLHSFMYFGIMQCIDCHCFVVPFVSSFVCFMPSFCNSFDGFAYIPLFGPPSSSCYNSVLFFLLGLIVDFACYVVSAFFR